MTKNGLKRGCSITLLVFFSFVLLFLTGISSDSDNGGGVYPWISGISAVLMLIYAYMISGRKVDINKAFKVSLWLIVYFLVMCVALPTASPELREQRKQAQIEERIAKENGELSKSQENTTSFIDVIAIVMVIVSFGFVIWVVLSVIKYLTKTPSSTSGDNNEEASSKSSFWNQLSEACSNSYNNSYNKVKNFKSSSSSWSSVLTSSQSESNTISPQIEDEPQPVNTYVREAYFKIGWRKTYDPEGNYHLVIAYLPYDSTILDFKKYIKDHGWESDAVIVMYRRNNDNEVWLETPWYKQHD